MLYILQTVYCQTKKIQIKNLTVGQVANGTDWTSFTVKFTTPSDATTVDAFTWADNGAQGYLDNVKLVKVESALDWTEFDETLEAVEALKGSRLDSRFLE